MLSIWTSLTFCCLVKSKYCYRCHHRPSICHNNGTGEEIVTRIRCSFYSFLNKPRFLRVCTKSLSKNTVGKGEIARYEQFLPFPQCFSTLFEKILSFSIKLKIVVSKLFQFGRAQNLWFGKGLTWRID